MRSILETLPDKDPTPETEATSDDQDGNETPETPDEDENADGEPAGGGQ